jgi:hypothetical protein
MTDKTNEPAADKEQAEGERETVDAALENAEQDRKGGAPQGITNKAIEDEEAEQRELPPRGHAKRED